MLPDLDTMTTEQKARFLASARDLLEWAKDPKRKVDPKAIAWAHRVIEDINAARGLV